MTKKKPPTHFNDPIDTSKPLSGYGRRGPEVPPAQHLVSYHWPKEKVKKA